MYAVVRTGGKQYRVAQGDKLRVEKLPGKVGESVRLEDVLMIGGVDAVQIGRPRVEGAAVAAKILEQAKAKKVVAFKFKRRKGYQKRRGHRQLYTQLQVTEIHAPGV